jgi:hypothetical protein
MFGAGDVQHRFEANHYFSREKQCAIVGGVVFLVAAAVLAYIVLTTPFSYEPTYLVSFSLTNAFLLAGTTALIVGLALQNRKTHKKLEIQKKEEPIHQEQIDPIAASKIDVPALKRIKGEYDHLLPPMFTALKECLHALNSTAHSNKDTYIEDQAINQAINDLQQQLQEFLQSDQETMQAAVTTAVNKNADLSELILSFHQQFVQAFFEKVDSCSRYLSKFIDQGKLGAFLHKLQIKAAKAYPEKFIYPKINDTVDGLPLPAHRKDAIKGALKILCPIILDIAIKGFELKPFKEKLEGLARERAFLPPQIHESNFADAAMAYTQFFNQVKEKVKACTE